MQFIDSNNLPAPIKRAIEWQEKSHNPKSDISNTTMIDSPLRVWLRKKYYPFLVEEYSDRLWALYGTLAHLIVEKFGGTENEHVERDVTALVNGWVVSTRIDYVKEEDDLLDYKFTSVWSTAEGVKIEWERQTNVALWLLRHSAEEKDNQIAEGIKHLKICAMFRDWTPSISDKFPTKILTLSVPMWSDEQAGAYVLERVKLHQEATKDLNVIPPICSDSERWMSDFAIMKEGRKNALKAKIKTREAAEEMMESVGGDSIREAKPKRCLGYCLYAKMGFCPYWDTASATAKEIPEIASIPEDEPDPDKSRKDEDRRL